MGKNSTTQSTKPPSQITDYLSYLNNNILPMVGQGRLSPTLPQGTQLNADINPFFGQAMNFYSQYPGSDYVNQGLNSFMGGAQGLMQGNVPGNPLSNITNPLANDITSTLQDIMRGGGNGQYPSVIGDNPDGITQTGSGGGSFGPVGGYNPQTQNDIENLINRSNEDSQRAFDQGTARQIVRDAVANGGLGGSRQGIAEGLARAELSKAQLTNASNIRMSADNNERNRLASLANARIGQMSGLANAQNNAQSNYFNYLANRNNQRLQAATAAGGFTGQGYSQGMSALTQGLGFIPQALQLPGQIAGQGLPLAQYLQGLSQDNLNRTNQNILNDRGALGNDLSLYSRLLGIGNLGSSSTTNQSGLGSALGTGLSLASLYNSYNSGGGSGKNAASDGYNYGFTSGGFG